MPSASMFSTQELSSSGIATHPVDKFSNACQQYLEDHHRQPEGPGLFVYGMSQILGQTFTRRFSNLVSCLGFGQFFPAQRDYPVLPPCDEIALRFQPRLFTTNTNQIQDAEIQPNQLRYEILPTQQDKDYYSIVYYIGAPTEKLSSSILSKLYELVRPILYGSKSDWEAVQVDIHKNTQEPIGLSFETCNYSNLPQGYYLMRQEDLHLPAKISRMPDGTWVYSVQQKNKTVQRTEIAHPFKEGTHADLCIVSWNSSLDICDRVAEKSELKVYPLENLTPQFMDIDTYQAEGIDLRATWLEKRLNLMLPARQRVDLR